MPLYNPPQTPLSVTTKGDLQTYSTTPDRLPVGSDGQIPFANSGATTGLQYLSAFTKGQLVNGKIVPSVASNNLTVAIKGIDGNDPSSTNPVYVRIGDTIRSITAALSVTTNAATNWFNSGGAPLATKEVDYFVYLGYNATDGVVIGFSPFPGAYLYSDFSTTNTNQKFCAISTITNAAAGDDYEVVGRFAATLSAGTGYTWTVPTFTNKNLIQRPTRETRELSFTCTYSNPFSMTVSLSAEIQVYYHLVGNICYVHWGRVQLSLGGTPDSIILVTLPKTATGSNTAWSGASCYQNSTYNAGEFTETTTTTVQVRLYAGGTWANGSAYFGGDLKFLLG